MIILYLPTFTVILFIIKQFAVQVMALSKYMQLIILRKVQ